MTYRGDAEVLEILGSQFWQHVGVNGVVAKSRFISFHSELAQPGANVHGSWLLNSCTPDLAGQAHKPQVDKPWSRPPGSSETGQRRIGSLLGRWSLWRANPATAAGTRPSPWQLHAEPTLQGVACSRA